MFANQSINYKHHQKAFDDDEKHGLSTQASKFVDDAFEGLDVTKILDVHVHLIGMNPEESGCYVHENANNCCRCQSYAKKFIILQASGIDIKNIPKTDVPYYERMVQLFENYIPAHIQQQAKKERDLSSVLLPNPKQKEMEERIRIESELDAPLLNHDSIDINTFDRPICPRVVLLGLDQVYNKETGAAEPHNTSVYCPAEYVEAVVNENNHIFEMGVSINPYRKDCIEQLIAYKHKGCNVIKWLPNSMGIDPMDSRCDAFYKKMCELDMFLLSHTGKEHSLDDADYTVQAYGNPLRLRRALDLGCKVIAAHCASEGDDEDLDEGEENDCNHVNACDLFIRLMREERYEGLLFGDISALVAFKRVDALKKIIQCSDIHHRLIYGSDYPVPAVNGVVWYGRLIRNGLISNKQADCLREVFRFNPVLADFVLKRVMRYKDKQGHVHKFADVIFQQYPLIRSNVGKKLSIKQKRINE